MSLPWNFPSSEEWGEIDEFTNRFYHVIQESHQWKVLWSQHETGPSVNHNTDLAKVESGSGRSKRSLPVLEGVFDISEILISASGVDTIALSVLGQDSSNLEDEEWSRSVVPFSLVGISWIFISLVFRRNFSSAGLITKSSFLRPGLRQICGKMTTTTKSIIQQVCQLFVSW